MYLITKHQSGEKSSGGMREGRGPESGHATMNTSLDRGSLHGVEKNPTVVSHEKM